MGGERSESTQPETRDGRRVGTRAEFCLEIHEEGDSGVEEREDRRAFSIGVESDAEVES